MLAQRMAKIKWHLPLQTLICNYIFRIARIVYTVSSVDTSLSIHALTCLRLNISCLQRPLIAVKVVFYYF
jgi:hypothetical protein